MKMDQNTVIQLLTSKNLNWKQVRGLTCVHTFHNGLYINLCRYSPGGKWVISLNVDDFKRQIDNIVDVTFSENSNEYKLLLPVYNSAIQNSEKIVPEPQY